MSVLEAGRQLLYFRVEEKLGGGGMGEVYRAFDTRLNRPVALKILPDHAGAGSIERARFREEARLASALNHPNVVTIYAIEETEGHTFIVMEYVEGETLLARLRKSPLEYPQLLEIAIQVSEALAAAHALGLVHRDIKPANILLTREGRAKVADFGIAKQVEGFGARSDDDVTLSAFTQPGMLVGTPAYMSPEQARGEPLDARTDLFSLGVTLYQAATGKLPFEGATPYALLHALATTEPPPVTRLQPRYPSELDRVLARTLTKNREERYATARELADVLRGLREEAGTAYVPVTTVRAVPTQVPNNLPVPLTSFIGRGRERAEVRRLFASTRLVSVIGGGGCGKTRLAIEVARDMLEEAADGVWLVELATLADPELVPQAVAEVMGIRDGSGRPVTASVADAIGSKAMLLLLDNCEHLASGCARLVASLLGSCPGLRVLVTSQEGLWIPGEILWRIPTLSVPDVRAAVPGSVEAASRFESVRLFVERAVSVKPSFGLTPTNAAAIATICHRLDGIPLAIELAAVRVRVLPVEEILSRLQDRFHLLTGGSRTALPKQKTLRAAVDWSYELLSASERTLLNRLGIFAGGFTLESAEAICAWGALESEDTLDLVTRLVDKSLVISLGDSDGGMRYGMLETIRAYARERAVESGERALVEERHAEYFLKLAEEAEPELVGPDQARWLNRLHEEHDNVRQAIQTFIDGRNAEAAQRLCGAFWRFWWIRGGWKEGRSRLEAALALGGSGAPTRPRAKALRGAGVLARGLGDFNAARALLADSLESARATSDRAGVAAALFGLGNIANDNEELDAARALYEECLGIRREIGDQWGIALTLHNLGVVAEAREDFTSADGLYAEALALHRTLGNRAMEAATRNGLGVVSTGREDYAAARFHHEQALMIQRDLSDKRGIAFSLRELGSIAVHLKDVGSACSHLVECMEILECLEDPHGIAAALEACAGAAAAAGQAACALELTGAAASLRGSLGAPLSKPDEERLRAKLAPAREALGPEAAQRHFEQGKRLTQDAALQIARATAATIGSKADTGAG